jgi:hypothetical protein
MHIQFTEVLRWILGLIAGGVIGYGFGRVQLLALRRNERKQQLGDLKTGWAVMPGSMTRVAGLMLVLVAVQVFCPMLFSQGTQWWVSGGICLGYGSLLLARLRQA